LRLGNPPMRVYPNGGSRWARKLMAKAGSIFEFESS
jgi:hypothetical protein